MFLSVHPTVRSSVSALVYLSVCYLQSFVLWEKKTSKLNPAMIIKTPFSMIFVALSSKNPTKRKHARKVTTVFLLFLWFERGEVSAFFCVSFLGFGGGGVWRVGVGDLGSVSMDFRFISGRMIYFSLSRTLSLQTAHGRMCVCKREREREREGERETETERVNSNLHTHTLTHTHTHTQRHTHTGSDSSVCASHNATRHLSAFTNRPSP